MANYTQHYHLHQWEPEDSFLRTDFNGDLSAIDAALLGLQREIPTLSRKNWGFLAVSGVSTGLSWMFYYRALQEGPASVVAPIDKLSILVTVGFSCLVLRERLSRRAAAGLLVLTCGTLLLLL